MGYWAELDDSNRVIRVIVADSEDICQRVVGVRPDRTERRWVETRDDDPDEGFAGIGDVYNPRQRRRFIPDESRRRGMPIEDLKVDDQLRARMT